MIDGGNKSKRAAQGAAGLSKTTSAFGIAGKDLYIQIKFRLIRMNGIRDIL